MATTWCPDLSGDGALTLVGAAHDKFMNLGTYTYNLAVSNLDGFNNIILEPYEFNVDFNYIQPQSVFLRPPRPDLDEGALEFRDPNLPLPAAPSFNAAPLTFTEAPTFDDVAPSLTFGSKPTAPNLPVPTAPANPAELVMPDAPDYTLPALPSFVQLNLPDVPTITLPEFTEDKPVFIEPPFNQNWDFQPEAYTENLVTAITNVLRPMIVGSEALPRIIEEALFQRGIARIEIDTNKTVDQIFADTANRGFDIPQGVTFGRALEARQTGQNAIAEVSRDVAIKQFEESLASQRFAITQGAALEATLVQLHVEEQRFLLQAAQFQRESAVAVFNIRRDVFLAQLEAYKTDAAVLRDRIQAELAKVEVFRAQIEGERAKGEINEQRVRLYLAQWQGVQAMVDFYKGRIEAVKVQADVNRFAIDRFKAEIEAYSERWRAHVAEWQGYTASVEGEGKRVDIYRTQVDANAKRVDAWATSNNMQIEARKLEVAQHGLNLDVWRGGLARYEAALSGERSRLAAAAQAIDAKARIYASDASIEAAASAANDRTFQLGLERERADVDTQLKVADMKIQQVRGLIDQLIEIQKAKTTVAAQLASSTMSAVNYGASVNSGRSRSISCSQNFSFQGEIADAGI